MKRTGFERQLTLSARLILVAIDFYQRHLSPRKGFRCAHARLHGGSGCSGFVRQAVAQHGAWAAIPRVRSRFGACKDAAQTLRLQDPTPPPAPGQREKSKNKDCDCDCLPNFPVCGCADAACDCGPGDTGCCDCGPCS